MDVQYVNSREVSNFFLIYYLERGERMKVEVLFASVHLFFNGKEFFGIAILNPVFVILNPTCFLILLLNVIKGLKVYAL